MCLKHGYRIFAKLSDSICKILLPNGPFYLLKRGLDRASKSGEFMQENKSMTPVLIITMLAVAKVASEHFSEN